MPLWTILQLAVSNRKTSTNRAACRDKMWPAIGRCMWNNAVAQRAAQGAQMFHAPRAAIEHLTRAIVAGQHLGDVPLVSLHRARGDAFETVGAFDRARSDYEQALVLARADEDHQAECQARLDLGFEWGARNFERAGEKFGAGYDHT